eukprot:10990168-Alexandrium_andersonii.AAC.1
MAPSPSRGLRSRLDAHAGALGCLQVEATTVVPNWGVRSKLMASPAREGYEATPRPGRRPRADQLFEQAWVC